LAHQAPLRWRRVGARLAPDHHVLQRLTHPAALPHGDCRLDHVMFQANGAPVLIDWQLT